MDGVINRKGNVDYNWMLYFSMNCGWMGSQSVCKSSLQLPSRAQYLSGDGNAQFTCLSHVVQER